MKSFFYLSLLSPLLILGIACQDEAQLNPLPDCIATKIMLFEQDVCETRANVTQYEFQGETVYVFDVGSCGADFVYPVLTVDCDTLCFLGGLIGNINCEQVIFADVVRDAQVVWSN